MPHISRFWYFEVSFFGFILGQLYLLRRVWFLNLCHKIHCMCLVLWGVFLVCFVSFENFENVSVIFGGGVCFLKTFLN